MFGIECLEVGAAADKNQVGIEFFLIADVYDLVGDVGDAFTPMEFDPEVFGQPSGQCGNGLTGIDDHFIPAAEAAEQGLGEDGAGGGGNGLTVQQFNGTAL